MPRRKPQLLSLKSLTLLLSSAIFFLLSIRNLDPSGLGLVLRVITVLCRCMSSEHSRIRGTTASLAPVTIRNFRVMTSPERTRLVLDLDRHATVIEQRAADPRSRGDRPSQRMAQPTSANEGHGWDHPVSLPVTQLPSHAVAVSLPTTSFRTYKHFTLSHPPRLVIDVTPPIAQVPPSRLTRTRSLSDPRLPLRSPSRRAPRGTRPL